MYGNIETLVPNIRFFLFHKVLPAYAAVNKKQFDHKNDVISLAPGFIHFQREPADTPQALSTGFTVVCAVTSGSVRGN